MLDVNEDWLGPTADEVRAVGGDDSVLALVADVSDPDSAEEAVRKTIAALGGLHVLVNNAGVTHDSGPAGGDRTGFWDITPETWARIVAVNSSGAFHMARACVGHMLAQGWGRIIGVTTSVDSMYREGMCPYGPSKALTRHSSRSWRESWTAPGHGQRPHPRRDDRHQPVFRGQWVRPGGTDPAGGDAGASGLARIRRVGGNQRHALHRVPLG